MNETTAPVAPATAIPAGLQAYAGAVHGLFSALGGLPSMQGVAKFQNIPDAATFATHFQNNANFNMEIANTFGGIETGHAAAAAQVQQVTTALEAIKKDPAAEAKLLDQFQLTGLTGEALNTALKAVEHRLITDKATMEALTQLAPALPLVDEAIVAGTIAKGVDIATGKKEEKPAALADFAGLTATASAPKDLGVKTHGQYLADYINSIHTIATGKPGTLTAESAKGLANYLNKSELLQDEATQAFLKSFAEGKENFNAYDEVAKKQYLTSALATVKSENKLEAMTDPDIVATLPLVTQAPQIELYKSIQGDAQAAAGGHACSGAECSHCATTAKTEAEPQKPGEHYKIPSFTDWKTRQKTAPAPAAGGIKM